MFKSTGKYIRHYTESKWNPMPYYTFIPSPLFNSNLFTIDEELASLLASTHRLLGILEGISVYIPNNENVKELMILKEVCFSLQIDGKGTTLQEALINASSGKDKLSIVLNAVSALKYSLEKPVLERELTKVINIIMDNPNDEVAIGIRENQKIMYNVRTNLKIYNPTAPEHIKAAVYDLIKFINASDLTDVLIKASLAHYQFEMIKPYYSYNGFVGRLLVPMILANSQFLSAPFLCLSEYLLHNKTEYFDKLNSTQMNGDYLSWVKFFTRVVCFAAEKAIFQIQNYERIVAQDSEKINFYKSSTKSIIMVYSYYKRHLISDIKTTSEQLMLAFNTVSKAVDVLLEIGILYAANNQTRNRLFGYKDLINLFD